jgi:hypothetical protein
MRWIDADRITKCALRITFGALFCVAFGNFCFAGEPPLGVPLAGALPGTAGCDVIFGGGLYAPTGLAVSGTSGASTASGNYKTNTIANTGVTQVSPNGNENFGSNIPLYGTDLNGNLPLYSTPDLGSSFPLYSTPVPGLNSPLFSNPNIGNYNGSIGAGGLAGPAAGGLPLQCKGGFPIGGWVLYPSLSLSTLLSDNLFLSVPPLKVVGFGATPRLTAEWSNGIHTTTIYGTVTGEVYSDSAINTLNGELNLTQRYSPLPDLVFTAQGDYNHQTIQSGLTNSIPTGVTTPAATPTLLPNGNILLPNGNIVAPNGQIVGQANPALAFSGTTFVNPVDLYTATGSVSKVLNGGIVSLGSSFAENNYQNLQGTGATAFTSFKTATFTEDVSFALGPLFYFYSDGSYSLRNENSSIDQDSSAYRVIGGLGTRQLGLFRVSAYFGHQGSSVEGSGTAGGNVYGGAISYYPTLVWTITAAVDQTNNISSQTVVSNQALTLATNIPVQIALSSSSQVTTSSIQSIYQISPLWTLFTNLSYSNIISSPTVTQAWLADLQLSYQIWRNMTLAGQYQFSSIWSNQPGGSAQRNLFMLSADYRF